MVIWDGGDQILYGNHHAGSAKVSSYVLMGLKIKINGQGSWSEGNAICGIRVYYQRNFNKHLVCKMEVVQSIRPYNF